ncbi:uncharacterized protein METZ01_LOCUS467923, partial [marine metagenome]
QYIHSLDTFQSGYTVASLPNINKHAINS